MPGGVKKNANSKQFTMLLLLCCQWLNSVSVSVLFYFIRHLHLIVAIFLFSLPFVRGIRKGRRHIEHAFSGIYMFLCILWHSELCRLFLGVLL